MARPAARTPAPFRLRLFFRGVFLLLAVATVAIALSVLQDEKELSHRSYREGFAKTMAQVAAQLRHPAGQLALLNPPRADAGAADPGVHPLLLPFSALDFDDPGKVEQAVEMAGCTRQYPGGAALCVAVGSNPWVGGFVYVVGHTAGDPPVAHVRGATDLAAASRLQVEVDLRGQRFAWLAPFEDPQALPTGVLRGRLTGFAIAPDGSVADAHPVRDFRGWLWQGGPCGAAAEPGLRCPRRTYFSVRLPLAVLHDDLVAAGSAAWPPPDLDRIDVRVRWRAPGDGAPLFDSARPGATPPFSLADLATALLPGETLELRRLGPLRTPPIAVLKGHRPTVPEPASWLPAPINDALGWAIRGVLRRLPVEDEDKPVEATATIRTAAGSFELHGTGDERAANRAIGAVATRVSWFVLAMLAALALAWGAIEWAIIRRITLLTRRSRAATAALAAGAGTTLDVADLRGPDELGVLAADLAELVQRVAEHLRREGLRAERERDQWMAVGHEIMSPLQSLIALHGEPADASRRYIERMQQAVRVLYGQASPSEAFQSTTLELETLELRAFLGAVAANAPHAGIADVRFEGPDEAVVVRADEYSLEDVLAHLLQNAQAHRANGTPIAIVLAADASTARIAVHNQGAPIEEGMLDRIFEYGVSGTVPRDEADRDGAPHRGQGLFVARTYLAKMGGTIAAENVAGGVRFVLALPRVAG